MEDNKLLDDKIAKERLKIKRIKNKVFMKKLLGIPDRDTVRDADYGEEQN